MALELYTNPMSRGMIAHWMLEELGQPYDVRWMEWGPVGTQSPEFLALNPMGKLPTLVHDGRIVTETAAICLYLADMFPEAGLKPGPEQLADYYRWTLFAAGPVEQAVTSKSMGWVAPEDKQGSVGYGTFDKMVGTLAAWLETHQFVCGDTFTAADVYVGMQVSFCLRFDTLPKLPAFQAYAARIEARPALMKVREIYAARMPES